MKKKILFIINPRAGTDRNKSLQKDINRYLNKDLFESKIVYTEHAGHAISLTRSAVKNDFNIVVAVGGDGSVNEVVKGLYGSKTMLAIIPKGSGNGLARSLKIPLKPQKAIRLINQMKICEIDVGKVDENIFVSTVGVGFDALVTYKFQDHPKRGFFSYIFIILKNIWSYKSKNWKFKIEGNEMNSTSFMLNIANSNQLGYGFRLHPHSMFSKDGFILFNLKKFPVILFPWIALRAFMGVLHKSKYVEIQKIKEIIIQHPNLNYIQLDGESKPCAQEIHIGILPKKIKVIVPENA